MPQGGLVVIEVSVRGREQRMPGCRALSSGCGVYVSFVVFWPSTARVARSTSTSTMSCIIAARVTLSSTSELWLNMYVSEHAHYMPRLMKTDPQGKGRETASQDSQGRDGREACEEQGCPRAQAGPSRCQARGTHWRGREVGVHLLRVVSLLLHSCIYMMCALHELGIEIMNCFFVNCLSNSDTISRPLYFL